jgi:hypothetical protein
MVLMVAMNRVGQSVVYRQHIRTAYVQLPARVAGLRRQLLAIPVAALSYAKACLWRLLAACVTAAVAVEVGYCCGAGGPATARARAG